MMQYMVTKETEKETIAVCGTVPHHNSGHRIGWRKRIGEAFGKSWQHKPSMTVRIQNEAEGFFLHE